MKVRVELSERSYDVMVAEGARHDLTAVIADILPDARRALIVTSDSLRHQPWFDITTGIAESLVLVPEGEAAKNFEVVADIVDAASAAGMSRRDVIVAVGGGATTDVAGFAAATYLRGIAVIHVATSLVAQVDAAVGGKTGVNTKFGKNLMGSFHQPRAVLCDTETLATLPARDFAAGDGEVVKCYLLEGRSVSEFLAASLEERVLLAVALKARIVSQDEREGGLRALLNYGHTLAHALEAESLAGRDLDLEHGEAVAMGLAYAARLARALGYADDEVVRQHDELVEAAGLSIRIPAGVRVNDLLEAMARDKKAHHDLTFVLWTPEGIRTVSNVPVATVREVLLECGAQL
jgi:5-deoxy-5-amino-3-dehydroquinate synthase